MVIHTVVTSYTELLLNLDQVGSADESNDVLLAEIFEEFNHFWCRALQVDLVPQRASTWAPGKCVPVELE